jgi:hypothetical protein
VRSGAVFKSAPPVYLLVHPPILAKADSNIEELDLSAFDAIVTVVPSALEPAAVDASVRTLDRLGEAGNSTLVNQVSERSVAYARERAAEMVGMRRLADGSLVENPNAEMRIDETTRKEIRRIIEDGLRDNIGRDDIADMIEDSFWFSEERAQLIATTEISMANSKSSLDSMEAASNAGVKVGKSWLADPEACDICQANEDAGIIPWDATFPSGDDCTPAHPNCECATVPEVLED